MFVTTGKGDYETALRTMSGKAYGTPEEYEAALSAELMKAAKESVKNHTARPLGAPTNS